MITITVTQDNKTLTITHPLGIPLTPDNDSWYSLKKTIELMLIFIGYDSKAANDLMPDCEECDVVTELNREHNAELSAQCERCEYKTDGVSDEDETDSRCCKTCRHLGVLQSEPPCEGCVVENNRKHYYNHWEEKDNVQEEIMEVNMDDTMEVRTCDNCEFGDLEETDHPCKECVEDDDTVYGKWQPIKEPPIITEEVEKDTGKDCENCEYFDNKDFEHPCDVCVCFDGEGKAIVPTHWQPISVNNNVSTNNKTTGKSEIKGWINRDIEL